MFDGNFYIKKPFRPDEEKVDLEDFLLENTCVKNMNEYVKVKKITNYGLEEETRELIKGLQRYKKSNVLILGKAGIGKTALVENLCMLINKKKVPKELRDVIVLELSLNASVAGTRFRGDFEEKIQKILNYVANNPKIILFIDEVHNVMVAGRAEGAFGLGDILKPYLARDEIRLIGATTKEEYKKTIDKNSAMKRRFYKLNMKEPTKKATLNILKNSKSNYERHYKVKLSDKDLIKIIKLAKRKDGSFPDKALDVLEDFCYTKANKKC